MREMKIKRWNERTKEREHTRDGRALRKPMDRYRERENRKRERDEMREGEGEGWNERKILNEGGKSAHTLKGVWSSAVAHAQESYKVQVVNIALMANRWRNFRNPLVYPTLSPHGGQTTLEATRKNKSDNARWSSGSILLHSTPGVPEYDSRYGYPGFGFPWFSETTPRECWYRLFTDKIDFKPVCTEVTIAIASEFIMNALDDSEPIADLQGNKKRTQYCQVSDLGTVVAMEETPQRPNHAYPDMGLLLEYYRFAAVHNILSIVVKILHRIWYGIQRVMPIIPTKRKLRKYKSVANLELMLQNPMFLQQDIHL
ncbi:hypothetical protein PR048_031510 [Dryococelus australis]|uniref:Uncharacterized protein n=1 Tax=Dryococelus australis TaxID=614101 RepID=A0ABQ9G6J0_9NEOP|nr:hypothetical protein PR048_031510 [Dryococelus australis]